MVRVSFELELDGNLALLVRKLAQAHNVIRLFQKHLYQRRGDRRATKIVEVDGRTRELAFKTYLSRRCHEFDSKRSDMVNKFFKGNTILNDLHGHVINFLLKFFPQDRECSLLDTETISISTFKKVLITTI